MTERRIQASGFIGNAKLLDFYCHLVLLLKVELSANVLWGVAVYDLSVS
jgi:hypothetical protein